MVHPQCETHNDIDRVELLYCDPVELMKRTCSGLACAEVGYTLACGMADIFGIVIVIVIVMILRAEEPTKVRAAAHKGQQSRPPCEPFFVQAAWCMENQALKLD